jgi:hypothetical protein
MIEAAMPLGVVYCAFGSRRFRGCGCGLATAAKPARKNDRQNEDDAHDESTYRIASSAPPLRLFRG